MHRRSPRSSGKALELRRWTLDPATGEDQFACCGKCDGTPATDPGQLEYQKMRRCPGVQQDQWYQGTHPPVGTADENLIEESDHCAGWWARQPAALEAMRARKWWEKAQLAALYPLGLPAVVAEAVDVAESDRIAWENEGQRLRHLEMERRAKKD